MGNKKRRGEKKISSYDLIESKRMMYITAFESFLIIWEELKFEIVSSTFFFSNYEMKIIP